MECREILFRSTGKSFGIINWPDGNARSDVSMAIAKSYGVTGQSFGVTKLRFNPSCVLSPVWPYDCRQEGLYLSFELFSALSRDYLYSSRSLRDGVGGTLNIYQTLSFLVYRPR